MNLSPEMAGNPPAPLAQLRGQHRLRLDDDELAALSRLDHDR